MKTFESGLPGAAAKEKAALNKGEPFVWFLLIGILSTGVDIGLLYVFTEYFKIWYLVSGAVSYSCGIVISYRLNKCITFHDKRTDILRQFSLFAAVSVSSLLLNMTVLYILVDMFRFHYLAAKGVAVGFSFFWNYFGQSRLTFGADRS